MGVTQTGNKDVKTARKRPPTFQHLPKNRAAKLKKEWVEKTKLRARWKAQKRKEGLSGAERKLAASAEEVPVQTRGGAGEEEALESLEVPEDRQGGDIEFGSSPSQLGDDSDDGEGESRGGNSDEDEGEESEDSHDEEPKKKVKKVHFGAQEGLGNKMRNQKLKPKLKALSREKVKSASATDAEPQSLRDLERIAYSPSSLHSYKADPLRKRKSTFSTNTATSGRGGRGRGGLARGVRGGSNTSGRGQPNMKLRMNAMLERIKRDYT